MPEQLTAFSVLALLGKVRAVAPLAESQKEKLDSDIRRIEESHFANSEGGELELDKIASHWLSKAN